MRDEECVSGWKRVAGRLQCFDWLASGKAARGREAVLHGASFLMALVLLVAGYGQLVQFPLWSALVLALFGCGYAVACRVFCDSLYVYPALSLWTFAFFLVCFAAGLPPLIYPVIATLLLWLLWLRSHSPAREPSVAEAMRRCILLTVIFFGGWACFYHGEERIIPAAAFMLYGLSLTLFHFNGARRSFAYAASLCLSIGSFYTAHAAGLSGWMQYGAAVQPIVLLLVLLGALQQGSGKYENAIPYYLTGIALTFTCLFVSFIGWRFLLDQLALTAVSLGLPFVAFKGGTSEKMRANHYTAFMSIFAQVCIYAAIPLVLTGSLIRFGHVMTDSAILALFCLYAGVAGPEQRGSKTAPYSLRTAFFGAAAAGLAAGHIFSSFDNSAAVGIAAFASVTVGLWVLSRIAGSVRTALGAADALLSVAAVYLASVVFGGVSGMTGFVGALIILVCCAVVLSGGAGSKPLTALIISAASASACLLSLTTSPVMSGGLLDLMAAGCLLVALFPFQSGKRPMLSSVLAAGAIAFAVLATATAVTDVTGELRLLFVAVSLGVPMTAAGLYYSRKQWAAMLLTFLLNAAGILVMLWVGMALSVQWLGTAMLVLVPFMAVGWIVSRLWSYAAATALALALGMIMCVSSLFGPEGALLAAALLCALFLHVNFVSVDELTRTSVSAVGHLMGLYMVYLVFNMSGTGFGSVSIGAIVLAGLAYLNIERAGKVRRSSSFFFFSLAVLPSISILRHGGLTAESLVIPALLVPALAVMGTLFRDNEKMDFCRASVMLGLVLALISSARLHGAAGPVFLLCLAGFVICIIVRKERFFIQAVLLLLALMGYSWIREFGTHFTQELYRYMLFILGLATVAEVSPYIIRHLDRSVAVPYIRLFTLRGLGFGIVVGVFVSLVCIGGFALAVTEHPNFCRSCHNMDQFFESWQHSSHAEVACVQCHYEPGFAAHVEGKIGAISQVVSFLTHRYGNKPHAEVSNKACMREGCHTDMEDDTDVFFDERVHFNHNLHHDVMVKGRHLPCTTCHTQETETEHIGVASSTCFLCHFYGDGKAAHRTYDCRVCHGPPEGDIKVGSTTFSHEDFFNERKDVDCHHCHRSVNKGDASVSPVRCQSCHYGDKLGTIDLSKVDELHEKHVHDRKVGCFECHNILHHGVVEKASAEDAGKCNTCHAEIQHKLQAAIYLGTAVPDVKGEPNVMYEAGISCNHCHGQEKKMTLEGHEFVTHVTTAKYCVSCHGDEGYEEIYDTWQKDTKESLAALDAELKSVRAQLAGSAASEQKNSASARLARADRLLGIVRKDGSFGVHNTTYIEDILDEAKSEIRQAGKMPGIADR